MWSSSPPLLHILGPSPKIFIHGLPTTLPRYSPDAPATQPAAAPAARSSCRTPPAHSPPSAAAAAADTRRTYPTAYLAAARGDTACCPATPARPLLHCKEGWGKADRHHQARLHRNSSPPGCRTDPQWAPADLAHTSPWRETAACSAGGCSPRSSGAVTAAAAALLARTCPARRAAVSVPERATGTDCRGSGARTAGMGEQLPALGWGPGREPG
jgi:hypothetical protein